MFVLEGRWPFEATKMPRVTSSSQDIPIRVLHWIARGCFPASPPRRNQVQAQGCIIHRPPASQDHISNLIGKKSLEKGVLPRSYVGVKGHCVQRQPTGCHPERSLQRAQAPDSDSFTQSCANPTRGRVNEDVDTSAVLHHLM